jgi:hypothetical protein
VRECLPVRVPDVLGEAIGWRAWRVVIDGEVRLASVDVGRTLWHPGRFATARCLRGADHLAPDAACTCGFYAAGTREYLVGLGTYDRYTRVCPIVIGKVALSGIVIPGSLGFRAERARPLHLHVPYELWRLAGQLCRVYGPDGVEVEVDNTLRRMGAAVR